MYYKVKIEKKGKESFREWDNVEAHKQRRKFTVNHLRRDGVFILNLIEKNAGEFAAAKIASHMWKLFLKREGIMASQLEHDDHESSV